MLKNTAALNPEITGSAASLKVFEDAYTEFKSALEGKSSKEKAPADALQFLKNNPDTAADFKKHYGYLPEGF